MERKLVTVRKIAALDPITGADAIEVATIDGWKVVTKKGEFTVGDYCVYFEIDSFLPASDSRYAFLMKSTRTFEEVVGHKLRTIKLRGQISQGLVLPVKDFPEILKDSVASDDLLEQDFSETLGIKKFEAAIPASLAGQVAGSFPSFIKKTDQERCQNLGYDIFGYEDRVFDFDIGKIPEDALINMIAKGDLVKTETGEYKKVLKAKADPNATYEISTKLDGSSCTFFHYNGETGACSRNLQLKINEDNKDNTFVKIFNDANLADILPKLGNIAIQGELMGPGIQGNREGLVSSKFFIFDVQNLDTGEYLTPDLRQQLFNGLRDGGINAIIDHVPLLHKNVTLQELNLNTVADLLAFAEGPSIKNPIREGVVFKRSDGKFSFKAISNTFLAKEKD